jgi:hypothetical protein
MSAPFSLEFAAHQHFDALIVCRATMAHWLYASQAVGKYILRKRKKERDVPSLPDQSHGIQLQTQFEQSCVWFATDRSTLFGIAGIVPARLTGSNPDGSDTEGDC